MGVKKDFITQLNDYFGNFIGINTDSNGRETARVKRITDYPEFEILGGLFSITDDGDLKGRVKNLEKLLKIIKKTKNL